MVRPKAPVPPLSRGGVTLTFCVSGRPKTSSHSASCSVLKNAATACGFADSMISTLDGSSGTVTCAPSSSVANVASPRRSASANDRPSLVLSVAGNCVLLRGRKHMRSANGACRSSTENVT